MMLLHFMKPKGDIFMLIPLHIKPKNTSFYVLFLKNNQNATEENSFSSPPSSFHCVQLYWFPFLFDFSDLFHGSPLNLWV